MEALSIASTLELSEWCLAAGFVRNLVWDRLHGFGCATDLNDIDLINFDPHNASEKRIGPWKTGSERFPTCHGR